MAKLTNIVVCLVTAIVSAHVTAEEKPSGTLADLRLFDEYMERYKKGGMTADEFFDRVMAKSNDKRGARFQFFTATWPDDEAYLVRLLGEAHVICAMAPHERALAMKGELRDEDNLPSSICWATVALAKKNKAAVAEAISKADDQCRLIFEFCGDMDGISESRLLDVIEGTDSLYIRAEAIGELNIRFNNRRPTADKKRVIEVMNKALAEVEKAWGAPYQLKERITRQLRAQGVLPSEPVQDGGVKTGGDSGAAAPGTGDSKGGGHKPRVGPSNGDVNGKRERRDGGDMGGTGSQRLLLFSGAVVLLAVVAAVAAAKLRKR